MKRSRVVFALGAAVVLGAATILATGFVMTALVALMAAAFVQGLSSLGQSVFLLLLFLGWLLRPWKILP